jgi:hypothetical protein
MPCTGHGTYISSFKDRTPTQIDYIFVSKDFKSDVVNCYTTWEPAIKLHSSGISEDHAMIIATVRLKINVSSRSARPDFSAIKDNQDAFNKAFASKYLENIRSEMISVKKKADSNIWDGSHNPLFNADINVHAKVAMSAIHTAIGQLPRKEPNSHVKEGRSEAMRKLREDRSDAFQKCYIEGRPEDLKAVRKEYGDKTLEMRRQDEIDRITSIVDKIENSEAKDSRAVWRGIRSICGNNSISSFRKPSQFTKSDGSIAFFQDSKELAAAWKEFAEMKFSATPTV